MHKQQRKPHRAFHTTEPYNPPVTMIYISIHSIICTPLTVLCVRAHTHTNTQIHTNINTYYHYHYNHHTVQVVAMHTHAIVHTRKWSSRSRNTPPVQAAGDDHHECNWIISRNVNTSFTETTIHTLKLATGTFSKNLLHRISRLYSYLTESTAIHQISFTHRPHINLVSVPPSFHFLAKALRVLPNGM